MAPFDPAALDEPVETEERSYRYANISGKSGIRAFATGKDYILITFKDGMAYTYTVESAGKSNIAYMKRLAYQGFGLHGFVSRFRPGYASKG